MKDPVLDAGEASGADLVASGVDRIALFKFLEIAVYPAGSEFTTRLFENVANGFVEFDEAAASYAAAFLRENASPMLDSLLHYDVCPDGDTAALILENLYGDSASFYADRPDGVTLDEDCTLADLTGGDFMAGDIEGVVLGDDSVGDIWREIGRAVIPVSMWDGEGEEYAGSAVIVSPEGHVMTAAHNILRPDGEAFADIVLRMDGAEHAVSAADVLYVDATADIAVLRVPDLARVPGLPWAKLTESRPDEGEDVMVIGYPQMADADASAGEFPRAYTMGRYFYPMFDDVRAEADVVVPDFKEGVFHITTARVFPGNSGGGYFNSRGELIGITSNIETVVNRSEAASTLLEDAEDPRYEKVLREIRAVQGRFSSR